MSVVRRAKVAARSLAPLGLVRALQRQRNGWRHRQQQRFDAANGVDTAGYLYPQDMETVGDSAAHATPYEATWKGSVQRMIRRMGVDTSSRTFVDVGSGKGAVLLYASEFPFRRIIGVEHEPNLHRTAEQNLEVWLSQPRATNEIRSVHGDARHYDLPEEPLVLFLANPFDAQSTAAFLDRLEASLARAPRPVDIVTFNRMFEQVFDEACWLERTHKGWNHATYRAVAITAG